jgi:hypothetical protein
MKFAGLIYSYFALKGQVYARVRTTDYRAAGFCFFKKSEGGENLHEIMEPLVVTSLIYYMNVRKKSIVDSVDPRVQMNMDFGTELNEVIIDIDQSNLKRSGVFSKEVFDSFWKQKGKRGRKPREQGQNKKKKIEVDVQEVLGE